MYHRADNAVQFREDFLAGYHVPEPQSEGQLDALAAPHDSVVGILQLTNDTCLLSYMTYQRSRHVVLDVVAGHIRLARVERIDLCVTELGLEVSRVVGCLYRGNQGETI